MALQIRPISYRDAVEYIKANHRHHGAPRGQKFAIACYDGERLCGVSCCGRPVARRLDDGLTCEVNRLCTDGTYNACSILYGASAKVAKAMGYKRIITYILESESGTSLKASGWKLDNEHCGGLSWDVPSRPRKDKTPSEYKQRWAKELNK